jgi:hypothetical protein
MLSITKKPTCITPAIPIKISVNNGMAETLAGSRHGTDRVLMIARRSAVDTRIKTLNQLRHGVFTAAPKIRPSSPD